MNNCSHSNQSTTIFQLCGVPDENLISIYTSLIRSTLDYGCAVWHTCLPSFLVEKIERIQKRFFRVIFPHLSYREALAFTGYPRLEDNRQSLCLKLFNKLKTQPSLKLSHLVLVQGMNHMDDCYVAELIYLHINVEQADIETVFFQQ